LLPQDRDRVEVVGPPGVMKQLGLDRDSAVRIMNTGLAGSVYTDGSRSTVACTEVDALANRCERDLSELPPALILRVDEPEEVDDPEAGRNWKGWHAKAARDEQLAGITSRWYVNRANLLTGQLLVVSVSGFVVEVARISGASQFASDRSWSFTLAEPDELDAQANEWRNIRTRMPGGGGVLRHRL
jgi:hypothetical protein